MVESMGNIPEITVESLSDVTKRLKEAYPPKSFRDPAFSQPMYELEEMWQTAGKQEFMVVANQLPPDLKDFLFTVYAK